MAHVDPARLDRRPAADAGADADLGLEQHPAAERDLVGAEEIAGRAVVDGDADPRADEDAVAELRRQAGGGVAGVAGGVERPEGIGLERGPADPAAAPAELDVEAVLDSRLVDRQLDVVDVEAAEQLAGLGGRRQRRGGGSEQHQRYWLRIRRGGQAEAPLSPFDQQKLIKPIPWFLRVRPAKIV